MTYKNNMTIYSFIIRHNCPNLLYVTYLHDVLYVCTTSICFLFSQRDHNENKVYFWPVLCYPCHSILIVKLLDTYIVFCKVVFYTHLLYLFVVANKYLLPPHSYKNVVKLAHAPAVVFFSLRLCSSWTFKSVLTQAEVKVKMFSESSNLSN